MSIKYSVAKTETQDARAVGVNLPISLKQSIEICNYIRKDTVVRAKAKLTAAIEKREPIPFKRFTDGVGHRKGNLLAGRYPIKACSEILKLIKSAEANALSKGLSSQLILSHISAKQAPGAWHHGRQSRRQMKRAHVEVILSESSSKKKRVTQKEEIKKEESKKTKTSVADEKESSTDVSSTHVPEEKTKVDEKPQAEEKKDDAAKKTEEKKSEDEISDTTSNTSPEDTTEKSRK